MFSNNNNTSTKTETPPSLWDVFCQEIGKAADEANCCEAADTTRNLFHLINFECQKGNLSLDCNALLKQKCLEKYSHFIDDQEGVNNYAAQIEKLVITPNPESAEWRSSLTDMTDEDLLNLLPQSAVNISNNDTKNYGTGTGPSSSVSTVSYDEHAVNVLLSNDDIRNQGDQTKSNSFNKSAFWERISGIVSNCESLWKEELGKDIKKDSKPFCASSSNAPNRNLPSGQNIAFSTKSNGKLFPNVPANGGKKANVPFVNRTELGGKGSANSFKRQKISLDEPSPRAEANGSPQFQTAREALGASSNTRAEPLSGNNSTRKCLGTRRTVNSKFVAPFATAESEEKEKPVVKENKPSENTTDERLKNIDPKMVQIMLNEIMDQDLSLTWDNIAGLEFVKKTLKEIVVWPMLRPDIFTGLRGPPRGILLFGPPGTGKTLIGKCVASQSKSTFFSISASSLGSKWVGEGEKLVRALFAVARCYQPAVIFIDEIDSLLIQRSDTEHESSRRIKTEFLVQFDGVKTSSEERLLIIGATNRPQELDEAARRRLVKRLYIPLPEPEARKQIIKTLLENQSNQLTDEDLDIICERTDGYSGADMTNLCKEAALGPIRSINFDEIAHISQDQVRPIVLNDFINALKQVRASVSTSDMGIYEDWNNKYGSSFI